MFRTYYRYNIYIGCGKNDALYIEFLYKIKRMQKKRMLHIFNLLWLRLRIFISLCIPCVYNKYYWSGMRVQWWVQNTCVSVSRSIFVDWFTVIFFLCVRKSWCLCCLRIFKRKGRVNSTYTKGVSSTTFFFVLFFDTSKCIFSYWPNFRMVIYTE